jgi:hypothetical protein
MSVNFILIINLILKGFIQMLLVAYLIPHEQYQFCDKPKFVILPVRKYFQTNELVHAFP